MTEPTVSIQRLKDFAYEKIPADNALREILLSEPDELGATEFCCKIDVWLKLLRRAHT